MVAPVRAGAGSVRCYACTGMNEPRPMRWSRCNRSTISTRVGCWPWVGPTGTRPWLRRIGHHPAGQLRPRHVGAGGAVAQVRQFRRRVVGWDAGHRPRRVRQPVVLHGNLQWRIQRMDVRTGDGDAAHEPPCGLARAERILITGGFNRVSTASCEISMWSRERPLRWRPCSRRAPRTLTPLGNSRFLAAGFNAAAGFQLAGARSQRGR